MNQIQLSRNIDINMYLKNGKYISMLRRLKYALMIFCIVVVGLLFTNINNNSSNFNNASSATTTDTTQKSAKITVQNNDPLVIYGELLKNIESKQDEKNTLSISIESSKARLIELMLKNTAIVNKKDSVSKYKLDSVSVKLEEVKKVNEQKRKQTEIDSINLKIIDFTKKIKQIDADIGKLNQEILSIKSSLERHIGSFIGNALSQQNGQGSFIFKGIKYYMCVVNMEDKSQEINFHLKNKAGKTYNNISALLKDKELDSLEFLMVTNAGMYTPNHEPQGLFIEKGKVINPLDESNTNNNTNFYLFPNGVFYIDSNNNANIKITTEYSKLNKTLHAKYATQSGPMLVIDNKIHDKFVQGSKNINIRSGVGITDNKRVIFLISDEQVNFWDFATVFKDIFGCKNALYLDGAISLMYLNKIKTNDIGGNFGPLISVTKRKK